MCDFFVEPSGGFILPDSKTGPEQMTTSPLDKREKEVDMASSLAGCFLCVEKVLGKNYNVIRSTTASNPFRFPNLPCLKVMPFAWFEGTTNLHSIPETSRNPSYLLFPGNNRFNKEQTNRGLNKGTQNTLSL